MFAVKSRTTRRVAVITVLLGLLAWPLTACGSSRGSAADPAGGRVQSVSTATGCGTQGPVVLALAAHADTPAPVVTASMWAALKVAAAQQASISIVSIDGEPQLMGSATFSSSAGNSAAKAADMDAFLSSILAAVKSLHATRPHADDLDALRVAAASLHSACPAGGTIYLQDSGLDDTGSLDFAASDLLDADPFDIVGFMKAHDQLPDLHGIVVSWNGLGDTALPQGPLDQQDRTELAAIWSAVIGAAGGRLVLDLAPHQGAAPTPVPAVTPVKLAGQSFFQVSRTPHTVTLTLLDAGTMRFVADEALFVDPAGARAAVQQALDEVGPTRIMAISLVGTTSSAGGTSAAAESGRIALSQQRATAVEDILVALGVPRLKISTKGVGTRFKGFERDTDAEGTLLPIPAAHNRTVIMTVTTS